MLTAPCPRCNETFRIPAGWLDGNAGSARCPWCRESLEAEDVGRRLPPLLIVGDSLSLPADSSESDTSGLAGLGGTSGIDGGDWSGDEWADESAESSSAIEDFSTNQEIATERPARPTVAPVELPAGGHKRRRQGSPVRTMLSVVLGGVMAVILVNGILFLIGRPMVRLGFYPFDGSFDPTAVSRRSVSPPNPSVTADSRPTPPPQGRSLAADLPESEQAPDPAAEAARELMAAANLPTQSPDDPVDDPVDNSFENPDETDSNDFPAASGGTDSEPEPDAGDPTSPQTVLEINDQPDDSTASPGENATDSTVPDPLAEIDSLDTNVVATANQERQIAENLNASIRQWDSLSGEDASRRDAAGQIYSSFAQLGALGSQGSDPMIRNLLDEVAQRQSLLRELALLAPQRIRQSAEQLEQPDQGDPAGAMIVGPIVENGDDWQVKLAGGESSSVSLPSGQTEAPAGILLGLGRLADQGGKSHIDLTALAPLKK